MNRIARKIRELQSAGQKALIPYLTPEFPFKGVTRLLLEGLASADADMIEVGIPFSDPLADGKTIQHSSEIALKNGADIRSILETVALFRSHHETPLILMGYVNPILRYGIDRFAADAARAGVDGLIVPDLPPEEATELSAALHREGVSAIFLIAPTTNDQRIRLIDECSTDISYCVSVAGVTGQRSDLGEGTRLFLSRVKSIARKPFVVGFGISTRGHVRDVWKFADGAVVGSAMIHAMADTPTPESAVAAAVKFIRDIRP